MILTYFISFDKGKLIRSQEIEAGSWDYELEISKIQYSIFEKCSIFNAQK